MYSQNGAFDPPDHAPLQDGMRRSEFIKFIAGAAAGRPRRNFLYDVALATLLGSGANTGSAAMATQIIMDLNGDTRHNFDAKDVKALSEAERRFKALTGAGYTAATRIASGEPIVTRTFDPTLEETLFFPRLIGG
jgi:hypothetical protein